MARAVATNFYTPKELTFQGGLGFGSGLFPALVRPLSSDLHSTWQAGRIASALSFSDGHGLP